MGLPGVGVGARNDNGHPHPLADDTSIQGKSRKDKRREEERLEETEENCFSI